METIKARVLSKENIFLSIYLVDSYIQNKELLKREEREKLNALKDVYNDTIIPEMIEQVQGRLETVLDNGDEFFDTIVYFKPKKFEDDQTVFRPLHTAALVDQIAMIAMLQVLVYDIDTANRKLIPSELSRLLPSNFYGNRISFDGKHLFKPWREQYQAYTAKANALLYSYAETKEYKYEVSLDLENFFPSINPQVLYNFIASRLPLSLATEDSDIIKIILKKLLIFKLCELNEVEKNWYLRNNSGGAAECSDCVTYAKGMPQGLPHTYFMANIFMLMIKDKYEKIFPGEMVFYVDDSVIFTNGTDGQFDTHTFSQAINKLNQIIREAEQHLLGYNAQRISKYSAPIIPSDYCYIDSDYGVVVHDANSKSIFAEIKDAWENSREMYLKRLSRETSNVGFDIYTTFSDAEISMVLSRTEAILKAIHMELQVLEKDQADKDKAGTKVYRDKLLRYKKYFAYRETILTYKNTGSITKLKDKIIEDISLRTSPDRIAKFFEKYSDDILASTIQFVFKRCEEEPVEEADGLIEAVKELEETLYEGNDEHSYIWKAYEPYIEKNPEYFETDAYATLRRKTVQRYHALKGQSIDRKTRAFADNILDIYNAKNPEALFVFLDLSEHYYYSKYVRDNSDEMERMILNAMFSYLFEYVIEDRFTFSKTSHAPIRYSEVRVLAMLRNKEFAYSHFLEKYENYTQEEFAVTVDYHLLQVMDAFKMFVVSPERIDSLILIHKYCCDTWKNGSKYLHFYTLHNQEHAVSLIRSSIQILHGISYFKLKQLDYFILFAACYLHDISMVTLPDTSRFYSGNNEAANLICTEFIGENNKLGRVDSTNTKRALHRAYHKIDEFLELGVRGSHARDSAKEIRTFAELNFIEPSMRELIARVSEGHGYDSNDIYFIKSDGKTSLVNEKFITIILRLSDLLDISRYRISKIILNHNLENLNKTSRFHWISHLITDGYDLKTDYIISDKGASIGSQLQRGNITEKIVLTVRVLMSQTTEVPKAQKCKHISNSSFNRQDDNSTVVKLICDKDSGCQNEKCNFLCKWFVIKNSYLFEEFGTLKQYLNHTDDNFFTSETEVAIKIVANTNIPNDVFDYLREYVNCD